MQGRRTGVGTTAEGDMIAALGLRYGTEEATDFSEKVHRSLALAAYRSSVSMAKERGAFSIFDAGREVDNPFINRLKKEDEELYRDMCKYGRRNIACLTIAPTGTTSLMTQTTSGIEPVFMPVYRRRRKVNPNDPEVRIDYVDETGDAFEEYVVYHHKFITWMQVNGIEVKENYTQEEVDALVARSPYYKATANDIDWLQKVRMQGRIQRWVDHSISVTINLPSDVSEEMERHGVLAVRGVPFIAMVPGREFSSLPRRRRRNPLRLSMNRPRHWSVLSSWRQTWFVSRIIKKNGLPLSV